MAWRLVHGLWQGAQRAGAITADTPAGRAFASFGPGSVIGFPTGALYGQRWIAVGAGTMIAAQVSLSAGMVPGQDLGDRPPVLRIGDRCVIGRGSHIVAHYSIVIGDDVFTGPDVYITDQNHGYADPDGADRAAVAEQYRGVHRRWKLARCRGDRASRRVHRAERGGRRRLRGPRPGAGPVRDRRGARQGRPRVRDR